MDRTPSTQQDRVLHNWRRLMLSALNPRSARTDSELPSAVPVALARFNIDSILEIANDIQHDDPNVSRILCEHAYSLSQSMDPDSEGRGVLQFKTGLMSVIKQKQARDFDRKKDLVSLRNFYKSQKDQLQESEDRAQRRKVFRILRVLRDVINATAEKSDMHAAVGQIMTAEFKEEMDSDAAMSETLQPYNILPLEAPDVSDGILDLAEVKAARSEIMYSELQFRGSGGIRRPPRQGFDIFDVLEFTFGFHKDNVRNQREHLVLLLANAQSQVGDELFTREELDEGVVKNVCNKIMDNYQKWCLYIRKTSAYSQVMPRKDRVALVALYLCIWGEAANVRFLPEGLCYFFHKMALELSGMLTHGEIERKIDSFLDKVIKPIYSALHAETTKNGGGKAAHSKWRNYDDFNEFFWSSSCFTELGNKWTFSSDENSPFFSKPGKAEGGRRRSLGKTSFVEHRTFLHLYHSFLRIWILLVLMFQGLTIIAFMGNFSMQTIKILLSLGLTYFVMKLIESILDVVLMIGAYRSSRANAVNRIFVQLLFFGGCTGGLFFLYLKMMLGSDAFFQIYLLAIGVYAAVQLFISLVLHIPFLRRWSEESDRFKIIEMLKWMFQERYFVGRGLFEMPSDYMRYVLFWIIVLASKFTFSYFLQIKPLASATKSITSSTLEITYRWHDFFSRNNHNAFSVLFLWAPVVLIYLLDISIWYTIWSALLGGLIGARDRLGEIRSLEMLRTRFESFPGQFVKCLKHSQSSDERATNIKNPIQQQIEDAALFAPFWNEIINCLRTEDYISNREKDLLTMPSNDGSLKLVQWPLFLLTSKIFLAMELAMEKKDSLKVLWEKLEKDQYMTCAVRDVYESVKFLLSRLLSPEDMEWFQRLFDDIEQTIQQNSFFSAFEVGNIQNVVTRVTALAGLLVEVNVENVKNRRPIIDALYDLTNAVIKFRNDNTSTNVPKFRDVRLARVDKELVKRLYSLLMTKESSSTVPKNLEARRRLQFFTNSLFLKLPPPPTVKAMQSFSVYTPYYSEIVIYSWDELHKENEDGITTLYYLQKIFPDEWKNFLERMGILEATFEANQFDKKDKLHFNVRLWASYRGQTLARTVRGMMYYRRALILQSMIENRDLHNDENLKLAKAYADLKFVYVITCQIYGQQKAKSDTKAADILYLLKENEGLRVAYINDVDVEGVKEYYSTLIKSDGDRDQVIYSIKLPGNPILGEGKPENQNHAVIFTRGDALQTIDMNQDNYFEEALKMRNLLEEFHGKHGLRPPTILGVREHVFTGSVSSLAWFMSNQETSFVTLGQRVLSRPLKVRMHYGHPDVFDRLFHLTRGGFSKASKVINISEDIYAGFNTTLRQGNVTHHEYIQVGKGRDVGLNQIALFEAKVSSGNGEQSLSRDVYRLGQLLDFFRMLSFYVTSVGYYVCTMMTVLVVYVFLYGKAYLALSGVGEFLSTLADITNNVGLQSALNTQFLFQIGVFTAIPMLIGFILEEGVLKAIVSFVTMQLQLCSVFFTFSLGTRTHYFGRTILHGGAKYRATGRGFVVQHIKFAENYRLYSRSHFVKALEIIMLLLVYLAYGFETSSLNYILMSFSSWFLALSWLFAPYIFNPSGFEWQKTVDDFDDWTNWLFYRGGVGVKADDSWETWWEEEQEHIRTLRGRILETILCLRFFFFQYGVVYHLNAAGGSTSLTVYGISWIVLGGIVLIFKIFSFNPKASVNFQMFLRLIQGIVFILIIVGLVVIVAFTSVTVGDVFASILALVPTGWGILSIAIAWRNVVKRFGLWTSLRTIARFYDAAMGMVIFFPIAFLSWFPFVSTFQTRLVFNQAFSRGLEISILLAGNRPNVQV